jgi:hypothetical protein
MARWVVFPLVVVLLVSVVLPCFAFRLPDIKTNFLYKARSAELSPGLSLELYQIDNYTLDLTFNNSYLGLIVQRHWVPLLDISVMSGFHTGYDPHTGYWEYGIVVCSFITW